MLLRPLPYPDAERLVILWNRSPGIGIAEDWFSTAQYFDVKHGHSGFEDVANAVGAAFAKGDRAGVAAAMTDDFVDRIAILGDADSCREQIAAFVAACEGKPRNRATFVSAYFQSTFEAWTNVRRTGKEEYYVGYNPVQVFDTDKILADFEDGHVIHVVRNPYSGFADTIKRPFPLGVKRYAWTWNLCQHMALTYREKYPSRFPLVRFEDLVANPAAAMTTLLGRLGLPMADECLYPSFNAVRLEQVYPWGTIRVPTPDANLATAAELSAAQRRELETETIVMQRLLGYDAVTW